LLAVRGQTSEAFVWLVLGGLMLTGGIAVNIKRRFAEFRYWSSTTLHCSGGERPTPYGYINKHTGISGLGGNKSVLIYGHAAAVNKNANAKRIESRAAQDLIG